MGVANIKPYRRLGLIEDPAVSWFPPAVVATGWTKGAPLLITAGELVEAAQNPALATVLGFAESPYLSTPVQVGIDTHPATGAGVAITRPRRAVCPGTRVQTFSGTLTTSGTGAGALALADVGTTLALRSINPSTFALLAPGGVWIVDRVAGVALCMVIALIDPIGATATDTPVAGNSGQALVEFVLVSGRLS